MKTLKIKIKIKSNSGKKLPDFGLGEGILAEQEITLGEVPNENNKIRLNYKLQEIYDDLLEETFERVIEVIE